MLRTKLTFAGKPATTSHLPAPCLRQTNALTVFYNRTPEYLAQSITAAREGGYSLGVKLVRGAYHPHEVAAHPATAASADKSAIPQGFGVGYSPSISPDPVPPVWTAKGETDTRYNTCVRVLLEAIHADVRVDRKGKSKNANGNTTIGVLFGTHNWESAGLIVDELVRQQLGTPDANGVVSIGDAVAERVTMGQLYGVCYTFFALCAGVVVLREAGVRVCALLTWRDRHDGDTHELPCGPCAFDVALRDQVHPLWSPFRGAQKNILLFWLIV